MNDQVNPPSIDRQNRKSLLSVAIIYDKDTPISVRLRNLSPEGCGGRAVETLVQGRTYEIELKGIGRVSGTIVWTADKQFGLHFDEPINLERLEMSSTSEILLKEKYDPLKDYKPPAIYRRTGFKY